MEGWEKRQEGKVFQESVVSLHTTLGETRDALSEDGCPDASIFDLIYHYLIGHIMAEG